MDCIFCKIIDGSIPSTKVYEDEQVIAIKDLKPQAPVHILIIPKKHIDCVNDLTEQDETLVGHIFLTAKKIASQLGLSDGYRIINNCGKNAGQTVLHLHFHLLAGVNMGENLL